MKNWSEMMSTRFAILSVAWIPVVLFSSDGLGEEDIPNRVLFVQDDLEHRNRECIGREPHADLQRSLPGPSSSSLLKKGTGSEPIARNPREK
jgi:hypothetical protein